MHCMVLEMQLACETDTSYIFIKVDPFKERKEKFWRAEQEWTNAIKIIGGQIIARQ